jgi:hypothetical protein
VRKYLAERSATGTTASPICSVVFKLLTNANFVCCSPALVSFSGAHSTDLLFCAPMLISSLVTLSILWQTVHAFPGFLESIGYVFGILLAAFTFDSCFQRDVD